LQNAVKVDTPLSWTTILVMFLGCGSTVDALAALVLLPSQLEPEKTLQALENPFGPKV
jgi:hypothetical protein